MRVMDLMNFDEFSKIRARGLAMYTRLYTQKLTVNA